MEDIEINMYESVCFFHQFYIMYQFFSSKAATIEFVFSPLVSVHFIQIKHDGLMLSLCWIKMNKGWTEMHSAP